MGDMTDLLLDSMFEDEWEDSSSWDPPWPIFIKDRHNHKVEKDEKGKFKYHIEWIKRR